MRWYDDSLFLHTFFIVEGSGWAYSFLSFLFLWFPFYILRIDGEEG